MSDNWDAELKPFAQRLADLTQAIADHCKALTDDDLAALLRKTWRPNSTNCWWATHDVAPIVAAEVTREQYARQRPVAASVLGSGETE